MYSTFILYLTLIWMICTVTTLSKKSVTMFSWRQVGVCGVGVWSLDNLSLHYLYQTYSAEQTYLPHKIWMICAITKLPIIRKANYCTLMRSLCHLSLHYLWFQAQIQTQNVALRFERACSQQMAAKEMVFLAEQGFFKKGQPFDPAWQEMLNHATIKVCMSGNMIPIFVVT